MDISIKDVKLEGLYPSLRQIGFDGLDCRLPAWDQREAILAPDFEESVLESYRAIRRAGLKVSQVHLTYYPGHLPPLGDGGYEDFAAYMLPIFEREIALTAKMDCPVAVIHLYFDTERETSREGNLQLLRTLLPILTEHRVVLAIENIYGPKAGEAYLSTAEDLLYYVDAFKGPYIKVCLDTGHAITRSQDPVRMLEKLGDAVAALHVHASVPGKDMHLPPMLVPNVDWQKFYDALTRAGYSGAFNMEIIAPRQMNRATALAYYAMSYHAAHGLMTEGNASWME